MPYPSISWNFNLVLLFLCVCEVCGLVPFQNVPLKCVFWFQHCPPVCRPKSVVNAAKASNRSPFVRECVFWSSFAGGRLIKDISCWKSWLNWWLGLVLGGNGLKSQSILCPTPKVISKGLAPRQGFHSNNRVSADDSIIIGMESGGCVLCSFASQTPLEGIPLAKPAS